MTGHSGLLVGLPMVAVAVAGVLLACSPRETRHGDIVPEIEPVLQPVPSSTGHDDEPLHFRDGACVGRAPEPVCEPVHLTTAKPLFNARACESRADCLPTEFCGAGSCRVLQGEQATLCVERAWYEGVLCLEEPTEWVVSVDSAYQGILWRRPFVAETCVMEASECVTIDLGMWVEWSASMSAGFVREPGSGGWQDTSWEMFAGQERLRRMIDAGCQTVRPGLAVPSGEAIPHGHYAIWYP